MSWKDLAENYQKSGIVLVLGAGVSVGSRLPGWRELLERVAVDLSTTRQQPDFKQLVNQGVPLPVIASIFEEYSESRIDFVERVRRALYRDFPFFPNGISEEYREDLIQHVRQNNPTLRAVASLCAVRTDSGHYKPNVRIRGIVSFNLDALLQAYMRARFEKRLLRTIERASASSRPRKIPIYHMHGFLRFDRKARDLTKECSDVVLTEQDYFNFFNNPASLFNYTFLYLLREATCLFVGLSMQDENVRRMLHLSKMERMGALINEGASEREARRRCLRHFALLPHNSTSAIDTAIQDSLRPLGTEVLWMNDFAEIPKQFCLMYEATGHNWNAVS